jgi:hypothetical protein
MGTIDDEFEEASVGEGKGSDVLVGIGAGVSVSVGGVTTTVEVEDADVGETIRTGAVDCGCNTFTWNEQALIINKTSRIQFLFMGWLFYLWHPGYRGWSLCHRSGNRLW